MKTRLAVLCLVLTLAGSNASSQNEPSQKNYRHSIYFESGADFINCTSPGKDYIRADVVPEYYYYEASFIRALLYKKYAGIKYEKSIIDNKIGLLTGMRITWMQSSIGKNTYWGSGSDYFYLLLDQGTTDIEFLRVRDITQHSIYMGIPMEIRIYPYRERFIQMYYKIGTDINFLLHTRTTVSYQNAGMDQYTDRVNKIIEKQWPVYASVYAAVGMKIGKSDKPGLNIEACVPAAILCNFNKSLVTPEAGAGFQINVRIPLK